MALPHEIPVDRPDFTDPAYQRFAWARYLRQEVHHAKSIRGSTVHVSLEGALELANLLDPPPPATKATR